MAKYKERFYLAGSWARRAECREVAARIERETGMGLVSRWLDSTRDDSQKRDRMVGAVECLMDLDRVNRLIVIGGDSISPGKHTEMGYALALDKPIHLVIAPWCTEEQADNVLSLSVFYHLAESVTDLDTLITLLNAEEN